MNSSATSPTTPTESTVTNVQAGPSSVSPPLPADHPRHHRPVVTVECSSQVEPSDFLLIEDQNISNDEITAMAAASIHYDQPAISDTTTTSSGSDDEDLQEAACLKTPLKQKIPRRHFRLRRKELVTKSEASGPPPPTSTVTAAVNFFLTDCDDEDDLDLDISTIDPTTGYNHSMRPHRSLLTAHAQHRRQQHHHQELVLVDDFEDDDTNGHHEQFSITSTGSKRSLTTATNSNRNRSGPTIEITTAPGSSGSRMGAGSSGGLNRPGMATRLQLTAAGLGNTPHTITCRPISQSSSVAGLSIASSCGSDPSLPICKICHLNGKDGDPLISPCRCAGTMQFIHCGCLMRWLEISSKKSRKPLACELCQYQYHWHKKFKVRHWQLPHCSRKDKLLHLIFFLAVAVMVACAVITVLCFKNDRVQRIDPNRTELTQSELITLICGVLFFLAFFIAMYVEVKARNTLYKLLIKFVYLNQQWYIDEYDKKDSQPVDV